MRVGYKNGRRLTFSVECTLNNVNVPLGHSGSITIKESSGNPWLNGKGSFMPDIRSSVERPAPRGRRITRGFSLASRQNSLLPAACLATSRGFSFVSVLFSLSLSLGDSTMNLDPKTLQCLIEFVNCLNSGKTPCDKTPCDKTPCGGSPFIGQTVIIRTRDAGVHFGTLQSFTPNGIAVLTDARRIWRWVGANTLNEVATVGIDSKQSRVSRPVAEIAIVGACELIPVGPVALATLMSAGWAG